ncbi:MAG: DUF2029 domain-containing protein [Propionibacteriaceae bacterium]|jgi:hypothetical protein|nr:DUF2029 domain-containing protein [Propionibacteriaceae bacterium]
MATTPDLLDRMTPTLSRWFAMPTWRRPAAWWLATRGLMFAIWALFGFVAQGDVAYYYENINALYTGQSGPADVFPEYPTPLIWVLSVPYLLGFGRLLGFRIAFIGLFTLTDAFMTLVFWRTARKFGTNPSPTVGFWIVFVVAMGPLCYMRLDLMTAALSAAALITLVRSQRFLSGSMIATGAAIKLWPALLWPAALVTRKAARRATLGFAVTGAVLAGASWLYAGWDRLVSPLTWQSDRGLQVESVWATPLLIARFFNPERWVVAESDYNAFQIDGPGSVALVGAATVATLVGGLVMVTLYVGWLRRAHRTPIEAGTLMIIATFIMIVTNKTFSPQYMIWLGGPVAGLLTISARDPEVRLAGPAVDTPLTLARRIALWTLILTALTQLVYPMLYGALIDWNPAVTWLATAVLVARNVTIVIVTVRLIWFAARCIAFPPRPEPSATG